MKKGWQWLVMIMALALVMSCASKTEITPPERDIDLPITANYIESKPAFNGKLQIIAYNIERDPREEWNLLIENSWVLGPYMKVIQEYQKTLKDHPNPPAPNFTRF